MYHQPLPLFGYEHVIKMHHMTPQVYVARTEHGNSLAACLLFKVVSMCIPVHLNILDLDKDLCALNWYLYSIVILFSRF